MVTGLGRPAEEQPTSKPEVMSVRGRRLSILGVGAVVIAADQAAKTWALGHAQEPRHILWTLRLAVTYNSGTAFGLGQNSTAFIVGGVVVLVVVLLGLGRRASRTATAPAALAMGLLLGGAVGNLADRLFRNHHGAVVDFIDLRWWPVFNVADAAITVGAFLLALVLFRARPVPPPAGSAAPPQALRRRLPALSGMARSRMARSRMARSGWPGLGMIETVPPALAGERVDRVVSLLTGMTRSQVAALVADGAVRLDDTAVKSRSLRVTAGQTLSAPDAPPETAVEVRPESDVIFEVVYADAEVIVVDKPAGWSCTPARATPRGLWSPASCRASLIWPPWPAMAPNTGPGSCTAWTRARRGCWWWRAPKTPAGPWWRSWPRGRLSGTTTPWSGAGSRPTRA